MMPSMFRSFSSFFLFVGLFSIILTSQVITTRADTDSSGSWEGFESDSGLISRSEGSGSWEEGHSNIECPLWHNGTESGTTLWYHHPMEVDKLKGCPQFSSSSCCTQSYGAHIQDHTDWIGLAFKNHVKMPWKNDQCGATLKSAQCLLCSPAQEQYVTFHSYGQTLHLCESFCEKLLYDCRDEIWAASNETVSQMYSLLDGAGDAFCHDIWTGNQQTHTPNPHWAYVDVRDVDCHVDKPCTRVDYNAFYTPCEKGVRSAIWYLKEDAKCTGGFPLPETEHNLPCNITCKAGQMLPIGDTECKPCPAGHFSIGGGDVYDEWETIPRGFYTYCESLSSGYVSNCGWEAKEDYIWSGEHEDDINFNVTIETTAVFLREGFISFEARVSAEPGYDYLRFYLDDKLILQNSTTGGFETFTILKVSKGQHRLQWVYAKDYSLSAGDDAAFIKQITLSGTKLADETCAPCDKGSFATEAGAALCKPCNFGEYSKDFGAKKCKKCPERTFSYIGAAQCEVQQPCDADDYVIQYGPCLANGTRLQLKTLVSPISCDGQIVIGRDLVPCGDCPPGIWRVGAECKGCGSGQSPPSYGAHTCATCPGGSYATPVKYFQNFDTDSLLGWAKYCTGECGSIWRLVGDYLDSGINHGSSVFLSLHPPPIPILSGGLVNISYDLICERPASCSLSAILVPIFSGSSMGDLYSSVSFHDYKPGFNKFTSIGTESSKTELYALYFAFEKSSTNESRTADRVVIHSISVDSPTGNAAACIPCPAGTYSSVLGGNVACTPCPLGTSSTEGSIACTKCQDNSIATRVGSPACTTCGLGTFADSTATRCIDDCTFQAANNIVYNLTNLARNEMIGPIFDKKMEKYYISVCQIPSKAECMTKQGEPIHSHTCQVSNKNGSLAVDTGSFVTYGLRDEDGSLKNGLNITYSNGTACNNGIQRSTTVIFRCDPTFGIGEPKPVEPVEDPICHYNFVWNSLYACPLCTDDDYSVVDVSDCVDNKTTTTYAWNFPKRCHGGVDLPEPAVESCDTSDLPCGSGQYYITREKRCKLCPIGHYCVDGGYSYVDWTHLPTGFSVTSGHWDFNNTEFLMTTDGSLSRTFSFIRKGLISTVYNAFDDDSKFFISIDGVPTTLVGSNIFATQVKNVTIPVGTHEISWTFVPGTVRRDDGYGAIIRSILVAGLFQSTTIPVPCRFGTFAPVEGMDHCITCPANTEALTPGANRCAPCPPFYSSLPGRQCEIVPPCGPSDFQDYFTSCNKSTAAKYWVKINTCRSDPAAPTHGILPVNNTARLPCPACLVGFTRQLNNQSLNKSDICQPCPQGSYMAEEGAYCVPLPKGSITLKALILWSDGANRFNTWPAGFTTGCDGIGCISNGWRLRGPFIDSGTVDSAFSDTWLQYDFTLVSDGSIRFFYATKDNGDHSGLQFFIDGVPQPIVFGPVAERSSGPIPLARGKHVVVWNYHHQSNSGANGAVTIKNLMVSGVANGGTPWRLQCPKGTYVDSNQVYCAPCEPGTASDDPGSTSCKPCPAGQVSSVPGSATCTKCPKGTVPNKKQTDCVTDCTFTVNTATEGKQNYDLIGLAGVTTVYSPNWIVFDICNHLPLNFSDPTGTKRDTYILQIDETQTKSLGKVVAQADKPGEDANLQLTYSTKEADMTCPEGYTTDFYFYCKMPNDSDITQAVTDPPVFSRSSSKERCKLKATWNSFYACRICGSSESEDYTIQTTECEENTQRVSYVRTSNCFGPAVLNVHDESCVPKYAFPMYVLIAVAVLFLVLALIALLVYLRYRSLTTKYSLLAEEKSKNLEMSDIQSNSSSQSAEDISGR